METEAGNEIGVGLIGYGLAGSVFHAPSIRAVPGLRLEVVVTGDPERAAQARRDHPGARIEKSANGLWGEPAIGLIVVATPNRTHVSLARRAVNAGIPVVVDKPLAPSSAEAMRLVADARERGVVLTVYQNRRWDGDFLTIQRLLAEGALGEVRRFESRFERWRPTLKQGWRQRAEPEDAGGLLFDLGSHLIDQAVLLFGPVSRVYAELDRRTPGAEVDDDTFVALTHSNGVRSHLWMSTVAAQGAARVRVIGSRAAYTKHGLDVQEAALHAGDRPDRPGWGEEPPERWGKVGAGEDLTLVRTEPGSYQTFYQRLTGALRDESAPPVDPADAVRVIEIIEAARASAKSGRLVEMPPS